MSHRPPHPDEGQRDDRLGAALSDLPVPDHGPTFWVDLTDRLSASTTSPLATQVEGDASVPPPTVSVTDDGPDDPILNPLPAETVSLEERRVRRAARRGGRLNRSLGAAAAAVALVVAVAGAVNVTRQDDDDGTDIRAAGPATTTTNPASTAAAPAEFSATYDGIEGFDGPEGCCSQWRLTVARDGSYRWTSTDGGADMAFNAELGMQWEVVSRGAGASKDNPNYFISTGVPADGPDQRIAEPDPLGPLADFVVALAKADDPRITKTIVAGRAAWHYDGPTVQDRLGGDGAPNHAVADVDQASGVLLHLTRQVDDLVVTRFTASDVTTSDQIDRSHYRIELPPGANPKSVHLGFERRALDDAAGGLPYQLLVPNGVPPGFALEAVSVDRDVPSSTGPEGMNPPVRQIVAMTWYDGTARFTVTLRPRGNDQWDDPFGAEGMVPRAQPVRLPLAGRAPLVGDVVVDAPLVPHLWGITGDIVVTVSGDLSRADLERVAGTLQPQRAG